MNPAPATRPDQHNGFNQLLGVSGPSGKTSFGYDGNGNQVSKTDALGPTTYAYNYDNRLVDIAGPAGSSHFEYDANGLRTKKSDATGTRSYLLDGLSVVAEYAPDASRLAWYTQSLARIDEVLSVVNGQGKYWYEADALGSTYAMTNAAGAVVSRSAYDVFGERALVAGADLGQTIGFTGREHDAGSGLVYARARYLQPWVGRWASTDPLGFVDGPATYAYARNSPARFTDPSGKIAIPIANVVFAVVGAVVGGVWGYVQGRAAGVNGAQLAVYVVANAIAGGVSSLVGVPKALGAESGWVVAGLINGISSFASSLFTQIDGFLRAHSIFEFRLGSLDWPSLWVSFFAGFASAGSSWMFFGHDSLWTAVIGGKLSTLAGVLGILFGSWNGLVEAQRNYYIRQQAMIATTEDAYSWGSISVCG